MKFFTITQINNLLNGELIGSGAFIFWNNRIVYLKGASNPDFNKEDREMSYFPKEVGWIWLRLSELRDVFFCDSIRLNKQSYNQTIMNHKPINDFGNGSFWVQGKQEESFDIVADLDTNLLEGYYIDRYPKRQESTYQVNIYLTIEL